MWNSATGDSFSSINNKTILILKRSENYRVYAKPSQHKTAQFLKTNDRFFHYKCQTMHWFEAVLGDPKVSGILCRAV